MTLADAVLLAQTPETILRTCICTFNMTVDDKYISCSEITLIYKRYFDRNLNKKVNDKITFIQHDDQIIKLSTSFLSGA